MHAQSITSSPLCFIFEIIIFYGKKEKSHTHLHVSKQKALKKMKNPKPLHLSFVTTML